MSLSRRGFIETASLSLLATTILPAALAQPKNAIFSSNNMGLLAELTEQDFEGLIGGRFTVSGSNGSLGWLTLLSVTTAPPPASASKLRMVGHVPPLSTQKLTGFSLRFRGTGAALSQGTYTLEFSSLGSFPLFLVPSGPGVNPPSYTAIFNRLG
jgi:hypothetical protein